MTVLDGGDQLPQIRLHLLGRAWWTVEQLVGLELAVERRTDGVDGKLRSEARVDCVASADVHHMAGAAHLARLGKLIPDQRRHRSGAVAQQGLEVFAAVAMRAELGLTDEQCLPDITTVRKLPDFHTRRR